MGWGCGRMGGILPPPKKIKKSKFCNSAKNLSYNPCLVLFYNIMPILTPVIGQSDPCLGFFYNSASAKSLPTLPAALSPPPVNFLPHPCIVVNSTVLCNNKGMNVQQQARDWFFTDPLAYNGMDMDEFFKLYRRTFAGKRLSRDELWEVLRPEGVTVERTEDGRWVITLREILGPTTPTDPTNPHPLFPSSLV